MQQKLCFSLSDRYKIGQSSWQQLLLLCSDPLRESENPMASELDEISQWFILTYWVRVTHIYVGKLTIIGSDNGLSPGRRQAIIGTNAGRLLIRPLGTNFSEILIGIQTFSFKKMYMKMSSAKWRPFCLGLIVLTDMSETGPCGTIVYAWNVYT